MQNYPGTFRTGTRPHTPTPHRSEKMSVILLHNFLGVANYLCFLRLFHLLILRLTIPLSPHCESFAVAATYFKRFPFIMTKD